MQRTILQNYLDSALDVVRFKDYCPNGLQVEGRAEIQKIVCGVTASQALIDAAIKRGADALLVHHGWFWRGEDGRVVGLRKQRMASLLKHDINLFAYHLPLDAHPQLGNNAALGRLFGWQTTRQFGDNMLCAMATLEQPQTLQEMLEQIGKTLGRPPMLIGDAQRHVSQVAWCTGAAQGYMEQAIAAGAEVFISGEISEQTVHLARESGVAYIAAGHHATERYGVQALGAHLHETFGVKCEFVDIDNPV